MSVWEQISIGLLVGGPSLYILWDVLVAFYNDVPNAKDTFSGIMRRAGHTIPIVAYGIGILVGHFWGQVPVHFQPAITIGGCLVPGIIVQIVHTNRGWPLWFLLIYNPIGSAAGAVFWAQ